MKAMITRKIGMASILDEQGSMIAVTLLSATPNTITQLKTVDNDGYQAVQLGFEEAKKPGKSRLGHAKKANTVPAKVVKEIRFDTLTEDFKTGDPVTLETFAVGDLVDAIGTSKGKGFAGGIKRHNFARGPKTHGSSSYRALGSIGSMYPQRIYKGKKMPGQLGGVRVTTERLQVALVDTDLNVIGVRGAVPGPKKSIVVLRSAKRGGKA